MKAVPLWIRISTSSTVVVNQSWLSAGSLLGVDVLCIAVKVVPESGRFSTGSQLEATKAKVLSDSSSVEPSAITTVE